MNTPEDPSWVPLSIHSGLANTHEHIAFNVEATLQRGYVGLQDILGTESGAVSVVGSGPSLKDNWQRLRDSDTDIIACNAAFQFLLGKGIVPKYFFCFDADPLTYEFITPRDDVTYLISSRCMPEVFEMLKDCKVIVWHTSGDKDTESLLEKYGKMEPMVIGGTAAITRCMILARTLGYETVHLWGCDSSFNDGETHIRKSTTDEKSIIVMLNKKVFHMAPWMAQQCEDFKALAPLLRSLYKTRLIVHGYGILPYLAETMGFETDRQGRAKIAVRHAVHKARFLWSQL